MLLRSGAQAQWVDAFGSRPGQPCKGRESLDGGPGETHFAPPVGNPSVFGRAQETRSCCVGLLRLPEAASRRSADEIHAPPRAAKLSPLSTTNHPDMEFTHPMGAAVLLGHCSTCSRRQPRNPFSESNEDSLDFFSGHTLPWEQCKADRGRYPRLAGMWPGTSRKRSYSGPLLNPPAHAEVAFPFL
jgi:hypothetical protein